MDGIDVPRQRNSDSHVKHIECIAIVENANFVKVDAFEKPILPGAVIGEIFGHNWLRSECFQVQPVTC